MFSVTRRRFIKGLGAALLVPAMKSSASVFDETPLFTCREFTSPGSFTSGVEGPACDMEGNLYAVNFDRQGTIGKVAPDGTAEVFAVLPDGSIGNGIRFDRKGVMYVADYTGHNILRIDMKSGEISVAAHESEMKQPNDIAIHSNGTLFASDPWWSNGTGAIWRIDINGNVTKLDNLDSTTNGIEISPAEDTLYVNCSGSRTVWAYDLDSSGEISNKRLIVQFPDGGSDGMRCDIDGRIYVCRYGKGAVAVITPEGGLVREIDTIGRNPSNIAFGGPDGRTCYLTIADRGNIETFRNDTAGRSWFMFEGRDATSVSEETVYPSVIRIASCYPNPFNASVTIDYVFECDTAVVLRIFNISGQTVEVLERGTAQAGRYSRTWHADGFPSGVYFVSLESGGIRKSEKITLVK